MEYRGQEKLSPYKNNQNFSLIINPTGKERVYRILINDSGYTEFYTRSEFLVEEIIIEDWGLISYVFKNSYNILIASIGGLSTMLLVYSLINIGTKVLTILDYASSSNDLKNKLEEAVMFKDYLLKMKVSNKNAKKIIEAVIQEANNHLGEVSDLIAVTPRLEKSFLQSIRKECLRNIQDNIALLKTQHADAEEVLTSSLENLFNLEGEIDVLSISISFVGIVTSIVAYQFFGDNVGVE
jgi:hypothetical protein